jgi:hypothetical protein
MINTVFNDISSLPIATDPSKYSSIENSPTKHFYDDGRRITLFECFNTESKKRGSASSLPEQITFHEKDIKGHRFCSFCLNVKVFVYLHLARSNSSLSTL